MKASLTRALLSEGAARVVTVERDARAIPALEQVASAWPGKLHIVEDDALGVDEPRMLAEHGLVLLLKGHGTVVTDGRRVYLNPTGNPGMATGGTGDVLTGLIASDLLLYLPRALRR